MRNAQTQEFIPKLFIINSFLPALVKIALILLVGWLMIHFFTRMVSRYLTKKGTQQSLTLMRVINNVIRYVIYFFMFASIMDIFGVNVTSILAVAGIGSVALGFGAQTLVKDVINGLFILVEEQYAIGDIIEVNDKAGKVEDIDLRKTILRNGVNNEVYIIPNSEISIVTNKTKDIQRAVVNYLIPYECDRQLALDTIQAVLDDYDYQDKALAKPTLSGITAFLDDGMNVRVTCDCDKGKAYAVEKDLRLLIKDALDEKDITMPYKTQTIYLEK